MALPLASSRNQRRLALAGAGLLAIVAAFALDGVVDRWAFRPVPDTGWRVAFALSKYGDWPPILLAGLAATGVLMASRKIAAGRLVLLILVAGLLTGLGATVIRSVTGRTRPSAPVPQAFYGVRHDGHWIAGQYQFGSFPSGHTACWAGLAGAAWFRLRRLALAFLAAAVAVAWSRMALGCHHFSDVTASLVWGFAVGPWMADRIASLSKGFNLPPAKSPAPSGRR